MSAIGASDSASSNHAFLRPAQCETKHEPRALIERMTHAGQRCADARVVRDAAVFQRHVEVFPDQDPLFAQIEISPVILRRVN